MMQRVVLALAAFGTASAKSVASLPSLDDFTETHQKMKAKINAAVSSHQATTTTHSKVLAALLPSHAHLQKESIRGFSLFSLIVP